MKTEGRVEELIIKLENEFNSAKPWYDSLQDSATLLRLVSELQNEIITVCLKNSGN